jgi:ferric-dicitrate binding protein FerR (iron transport regulator)
VRSDKGIAEQARNDVRIFRPANLLKYAAAVALLVAAYSVFYFVNSPSKAIQLTAKETQKEYKLFENTNVTLFAGTEIIYNKKANRQILLKGKASFSVQSKNSESIVVQAGETFIKDIGTVFTIDATTPEKSVIVEVSEGEVWFYTQTNAGIHIKAGESAVYDARTKQFTMVETRHAASLQAVTAGKLVLSPTSISVIMIIEAVSPCKFS